MTYKEIYEMVESTGYPTAYRAFPENQKKEVAPPFICFFFSENADVYADDANYQKIEHLVVELCTDYKDLKKEAVVESALAGSGMTWTRSEDEIPSERMYMVTYEMDVVINLTEE